MKSFDLNHRNCITNFNFVCQITMAFHLLSWNRMIWVTEETLDTRKVKTNMLHPSIKYPGGSWTEKGYLAVPVSRCLSLHSWYAHYSADSLRCTELYQIYMHLFSACLCLSFLPDRAWRRRRRCRRRHWRLCCFVCNRPLSDCVCHQLNGNCALLRCIPQHVQTLITASVSQSRFRCRLSLCYAWFLYVFHTFFCGAAQQVSIFHDIRTGACA